MRTLTAKLRGAVETLGAMARLLASQDATLRQLRQMLLKPATTEKTRVVLERAGVKPESDKPTQPKKKRKGHGRNPARAFEGAEKVKVGHPRLKPGDQCPECLKGKVYRLKEPAVRVRIVGQSAGAGGGVRVGAAALQLMPGSVRRAAAAGMGEDKRDETAASMMALLKYGSGVPFYRLEGLQANLGVPLPRSTQWDPVAHAAKRLVLVYEELIRQAAQGNVLHNDDTAVRILALQRETAADRTGMFTTGIVAIAEGRRIALFFSGDKHAGEKPGRCAEAACSGPAATDSNVRRSVTERAQAAAGSGAADGQLPRPPQKKLCRGGAHFYPRMPVCAGSPGRGVRQRRDGTGASDDSGRAAGVSSGA